MTSQRAAYELLAEALTEKGINIEAVKADLKQQQIETPSWGYGNSSIRFRTVPWPGVATTIRQKLDDAAVVYKLTGIASSVALHIPWDQPEDSDFGALRQYAEAQGISIGTVNPTLSQDKTYRLGSIGNPSTQVQAQALEQLIECCEIMAEVNSNVLSLWFADGTNYAGQDDLRARKRRIEDNLRHVYAHLPPESRMLIKYKCFEPAFCSTDIPDWGTAYAWALKLGPQAQVLVDLGNNAQGVNIEQIVAFLLDEGRLGGFHLSSRNYADDALIVGSANPYALFLIYNELTGAAQGDDRLARKTAQKMVCTLNHTYDIDGKIEPMIYSVLNCQEAYAKSLVVPRAYLAQAQAEGNVLEAHRILTDAYQTDVRPLLAAVREEMGLSLDPIEAYHTSGYEEKIRTERS